MTATDDILRQIPMDQLAAQLGTDPQTARDLSAQLIPTLLGGMSANAADPGGGLSDVLFDAVGGMFGQGRRA